MFWTIIEKEIREQMSSLRFAISLLLAFLFLVASVYMLASDSSWSRRLIFTGYKLKEHLYTNLHSWYWVTRDVPTLRILATGLDENFSLSSSSTIRNGPRFQNNRNFVHNPNRYLFSQLDFVFFINIVGSLLAFVFTFDAISGERHRGTLRLVMANPIPRGLFLLAKFLGSYLSFLLTLLPALIGVILVLYLHPDVNLHASDWWTTLFLFLLALLYVCAFFMLGLFVSCITKNPKTTLTALMMLWVILVLVVPNFSPLLASKLFSIQSAHEVEAQIGALERDIYQQEYVKKAEDFMREHGEDWEALSEQEKEALNQIWFECERKIMNMQVREGIQIRESFINEIEAQTKLSQTLSFISPSAVFVFLTSDVAQTGIQSERNFRRDVLRYRHQYAEHVNRYIEETGDYEIYRRIPKATPPDFVHRELSVSQVIDTHLPYFVMLVLYPFLFFFGAQMAFIRSEL